MCKKAVPSSLGERRKLPNSLNLSASSGFGVGTSFVGWLLEDSLPNLPFFNFQTIHEAHEAKKEKRRMLKREKMRKTKDP